MTVVQAVVKLITGKGFGVVDLDQGIAAPRRSIRLNVTYTCFNSSPITTSCERLECGSPRLIEFRFGRSPILETLKIQLAHREPPRAQFSCTSPDAGRLLRRDSIPCR